MSKIMTPEARHAWLLAEIQRKGHADILDTKFVDGYVEATGATPIIMPFGANKCPMLSKDLGTLFAKGLLSRFSVGIHEGPGWPKWIWSYSLTNK